MQWEQLVLFMQALKRCCMLNIPKPMTVKNFNNSNDILCNDAIIVDLKSCNSEFTML